MKAWELELFAKAHLNHQLGGGKKKGKELKKKKKMGRLY